jgi:diguanylate cyclase (GGDEF)-like protein
LPDAATEQERMRSAAFRKEIQKWRDQIHAGETAELMIREVLDLCQQYFHRARAFRLQWEHECIEAIDALDDAASRLTNQPAKRPSFDRDPANIPQAEEAGEELLQRVEMLQVKLNRAKDEAATDSLTRVANRGTFDKTLDRWVKEHALHQTSFVLALLDIDDLKKKNDSFGHPVGDRVLMETAQLLACCVRPSDLVARYGGEEFALLLFGIKLDVAEPRMNQLLKKIAAHRFSHNTGNIQFTLSCGMTEFLAKDSVETLLQRADEGLYDAKRNGKNCVIAR